MTRALADTSLFIARESGRTLAQIELPDELSISVITVGELRAGVLAASDIRTRDVRLATLTQALTFDAVPIDQAVVEAWALLRILLRDGGLKMPVNDSWIAATAMTLGVPVVTQDDDYVEIGGVSVIRV
jgi:predicted nucleic acid-binding protein